MNRPITTPLAFWSHLLTAILIASASAQAQSTWTGGGTTGNFSDTGNWNTAPSASVGNTLNFDGNANLLATNDLSFVLTADQAINFNSTASAFTISGNQFRAGGIANNSSFLQTINNNLLLNGTRTFNVGTAGIQLSRPVGSTSTSARTVTKTGAGELRIGSGTASSGGSSYSVSAGSLVFNGTSATSLGSGAAGVSLTASGTSLQFNNSGTLTMGGAISTVSGSSILLNNSGAITVTGGTTIAAGASLGGVGTLGGGLITLNGSLAPGLSGIGTLNVANLTLVSGSSITMDVNRLATQNADLLAASGILTLSGTLNINNLGNALQSGDTFNLFDGTLSGSFENVVLPTLDNGLAWDTSLLTSTGVLSVQAVPEPATLSIVALGSLVVFLRRRKA